MQTNTTENYLKALLNLASKDGKVTLSALSAKLNVSTPTANNMVKKLEEKGWVNYKKYQPLELTHSGTKAAALILRKHRLTEMFLVEQMNFNWAEVHDIAEQIEHIKSEAFFDRMDEMLGYPSFDPHGSPIPNKKGEVIDSRSKTKLGKCSENDELIIVGVSNSSKEFLEFLNSKNITLGTKIKVLHKEPFDNSLAIMVHGEQMTISDKISSNLFVKHY